MIPGSWFRVNTERYSKGCFLTRNFKPETRNLILRDQGMTQSGHRYTCS